MKTQLVALAALSGLGLSIALAHIDDPKEQDRVPRFEGPAYRADGTAQDKTADLRGFQSSNLTLLSWLPLSEFGNPSTGNDCWGYTSPQTGREYAIIGHSDGTAFVEVTDPGNAQIVANISGPNSLWRDIKVYDGYAYAVSEGGSGIQVFRLTNIDFGNVDLVNTVDDQGTSASHNVVIDTVSGFLYRAGGGDNGLRIYSLADKTNPTYVGSWPSRYVHDAQVVTYTDGPYAGMQVAFCCGGFNGGFSETGLCILDVTNKSNIQQLACLEYSNPNYSHQGWLSDDRQYFYLNDELDEQNTGVLTTTRVIDVSNLSNPVQVSTFTSGSTSIDHNLYVKDNLIYEANYRSGLRIFDATNPTSPTEVAYFDTWPDDDGASFNGLWSVYPFFESGTIIGSDLERGLFVWQGSQISMSLAGDVPELIDPAGGTEVRVNVAGVNGGSIDESSLKLIYSVSGTSSSVDMELESGNTYRAAFPSLPCTETASWYLTASSTSGQTVTIPAGAPSTTYDTFIANGTSVYFEDNSETDTGWSVSGNATDGQWNRGVPVNCARCDPSIDADGSGQSWLTDNSSANGCNSDVDGGSTILTSPILDASDGSSVVSYQRWYNNGNTCGGGDPQNDIFVVEASDNGGASWVDLELIGPSGPGTSGGWVEASFIVSDIPGISNTNQFRLRFTASDLNDGSVIEAGVDGVLISGIECDKTPLCEGDIDGNLDVNVNDLLSVIGDWGSNNSPADVDGSGTVDVADLLIVIGAWGPCNGG